ncbi:helix-turn-helix domain-containing protein [Streptomyces halobius]|uniref:Helix-turn-helix domain-containing protein n=1 Tax=Streptomyces halobius TaxID=2879846 RepID=A0ABY4LYP6_9ACTN|nr:helix-turn-helix transcriptional regulator [Streptomyces halobius]UQA90585.1 helix-turn-helix domain-containing protein [Streptomyces halobius]
MGEAVGHAENAAVEEFAEQIRGLKDRSGRSYGALARRLNIGTSTLYRYCSGQTVPERFTQVEHLARLCGATPEERRRLQRLWILADEARRPSTTPGTPAPYPKATAPRQEDPAQPSAQPSAGTAPRPDRTPGPAQETPRAPEPGPAQEAPPAPEPDPDDASTARRTRRYGWTAILTALLAVVIVVGATVSITVAVSGAGPSAAPSPDETTAAGDRRSSATPDRATDAPFTWTADSHVWQMGCGHTYLVDRAPDQVSKPPVEQDARRWADSLGAVHDEDTNVRISLQGKFPQQAVVLEALRVRVTERAEPLTWNAYRMDNGCGGALSLRYLDVDLDKPRPLVRSVAGFDGMAGKEIPAVSFPYTVTSADPEVLLVTARTTTCDCRWYLELDWSSQGRSGTVRITDNGRPFRTSSTTGKRYVYGDRLPPGWNISPD